MNPCESVAKIALCCYQCRCVGPQQLQPPLVFIGHMAGMEDDGDCATDAVKVENFFVSFFEPQCGHATVPSHFVERTSDSKSFSHLLQTNS